MKRLLVVLVCAVFFCQSANAIMVGTYKSETEYGIFDGFKFNFFKRKPGQKIIEIKSETPEEKTRLEREKNKPQKPDVDEHEMFKFMQGGVIPI